MALKTGVLLLTALAGVLVATFFITMAFEPKTSSISTVTIGTTTVAVEMALDDTSRQRGLSGRASLAEGHGMLFVFEEEGDWGIWMKDMNFPIDIIWATKDGTIVTIEKNVEPNTYPKSFYPAQPALYVLEVPAGFADKYGIAEGQQIFFKRY